MELIIGRIANAFTIQKYCPLAEVVITNLASTGIMVITMYQQNVPREYVSLAKRTVEAQLNNELIQDYGFPKAICRSLVDLFSSYFDLYLGADRSDGQLIYRTIPSNVPPGVKTEEVKTHPVRLTLFAPEDIYAASKGVNELTRIRIDRLTNEAFDQGGLLTQADLAILLGVGIRTIGRRIKELHNEDIIVPTRGSRMDIGPGVSHKTKIVEMYVQGYDFSDIKRRTRHSSESITRYLKDFARIIVLYERGHSPHEIRIITDHSDRLVRQYLALYNQLNTDEYQYMLDQLRAMYPKKNEKKDRTESHIKKDMER